MGEIPSYMAEAPASAILQVCLPTVSGRRFVQQPVAQICGQAMLVQTEFRLVQWPGL